RTQTNGPQDYHEVHRFQDGMTVTPLSQWGKAPSPMAGKVDPKVDMKTPPMEQVEKMPARRFFQYGAQLMKLHPPHLSDHSQVWRLQRIGIVPGEDFDFDTLEPAVQEAMQQAVPDAVEAMQQAATRIGRLVNGWVVSTETIGVYGNSYLKRAAIALAGLGANEPEDAVYPMLASDAD
ncbi:MAG: hypothetical protein GTN78_24650, partial [Gemmatimonadales bacterium]|nr:hypothetical protein [Gemmatimonadales bacterium]